jgi:hypothetical protein
VADGESATVGGGHGNLATGTPTPWQPSHRYTHPSPSLTDPSLTHPSLRAAGRGCRIIRADGKQSCCRPGTGSIGSKTALAGSMGEKWAIIWPIYRLYSLSETGTGTAPAGTTKSFPTALNVHSASPLTRRAGSLGTQRRRPRWEAATATQPRHRTRRSGVVRRMLRRRWARRWVAGVTTRQEGT